MTKKNKLCTHHALDAVKYRNIETKEKGSPT